MSYTHLTPRERYVISHLKVTKYSIREIVSRLGRHHTTISREVKRNGPIYFCGVYWYYFIDPMTALHGPPLSQRVQRGAAQKDVRSGRDAQGDPCFRGPESC